MKKKVEETFPDGTVDANNYGNVLLESAFLYGMGEIELTKEQKDVHDPNMQVIASCRTSKAPPSEGISPPSKSATILRLGAN